MNDSIRLLILPDGRVVLVIEDATDAEGIHRVLSDADQQGHILVLGGRKVEVEDYRVVPGEAAG